MSKDILITGFPGFIASKLLPKIMKDRKDSVAYLLVQDKFYQKAQTEINILENNFEFLKGRLKIIRGDLRFNNLGINNKALDFNLITEIFNLAAVYDLRVNRDLAYDVNVRGTQNILAFAKNCRQLEKFHHVSTCYVAGWYTGIFTEDDFDMGQTFKNFYDETKFISEKYIRDSKDFIPYIIYRPSVVIGDSENGETNKFDGPYPVIFLLSKMPRYTFMTQIGSGNCPVNLIHVDYVVEAIRILSKHSSVLSTYHLSDPEPLTQLQLIQLFAQVLNKKIITVKVSYSFMRTIMKSSIVQDLSGLYPEMIDYFDHNLILKCDKTLEFLKPYNLKPKRLNEYIHNIIKFAQDNESVISKSGLW